MDKTARIKMVKAMEYIVRQVNDETPLYDTWLSVGVADGDIEYGNLTDEADDLDYYLGDNGFKHLMGVFLRVMSYAEHSGGLFCDGVMSA